jgi:hypothetical protein
MPQDAQWVTPEAAIPRTLLDAHSSGQIVFFVGAGASIDAPLAAEEWT